MYIREGDGGCKEERAGKKMDSAGGLGWWREVGSHHQRQNMSLCLLD